jgi:hypothetical protein
MDAWQNYLGTESDPANGKWFRNGPNNSAGLFGGLTDTLATDLVFDSGKASVNKQKAVAASTTLDNRAGLLNDSAATQSLQWAVTNTASATHSSTSAVKSSISEKLSFKGAFGVADLTSETTISFEYSYSWSDSTTSTQTDTKTFTSSMPIKVPQGKAYKLVVMADNDTVKVPYSAQIYLNGTSETNFASSVNGKQNWSTDAGTLCSWIETYGSAGNDAVEFGPDPKNPKQGIASLNGTMTATQSVNFTIFALDVTSTLNGGPSADQAVNQLVRGQTPSSVVASQPVKT